MKNRIHIAHLIGSTGLYGAERWIIALMRAMETKSFKSTLINLSDVKNETSDVVIAARERGLDSFDFYTGGKLNIFAVTRLAHWARQENVSIIHGHGFKSDALGLLTAKIVGCKIVSTPHGWSMEANKKLQLYENLDRFILKFMDMVCPLSPELMQDLTHYISPKNLCLVLNGVDIDEILATPSHPKPKNDIFVLGYIGQLIERKDISTLLKAVRHILDDKVKLHLVIIGDGPQKSALNEESESLGVSDRVKFMGYRDDAVRHLKTFNGFVLPSRLEGIPRCIMEAMATEVPVIVSDIPGNRDLVSNGETGLIFPQGDSKALAKQILRLVKDQEAAHKMAIQARNMVLLNYSNKRMAAEYSDIYRKISS